MSVVTRETAETKVRLEFSRGDSSISAQTGVPFLDHMMTALARYSGLGLRLVATGDLRHHTIEDVAIAAGQAIAALGAEPVARYGERTVPMDEALVAASLDLGGRFFYEGPLPSSLYDHWMRSFAENAGMTLHIRVLRGTDRHHVVEAAFKAVGLALRQALVPGSNVFSTKGAVSLEVGT